MRRPHTVADQAVTARTLEKGVIFFLETDKSDVTFFFIHSWIY